MTSVILALGGNVGDVQSTFDSVLRYLQDIGVLEKIRLSQTYRSRSLLRDGQPDYYNCACSACTNISPPELLNALKEAERRFGRQETGRWRERVIDIDIIDYGGDVINEDGLIIPHPHMAERSFVLFPMKDLVPDYTNPVNGLTLKEMIDDLNDDLEIRPV